MGEAWEDLCRACVATLRTGARGLAGLGPWRPAGRFWHGAGPEWDVVSTSIDGRRLLLGEARWLEKPADRAALEALAARLVAKGRPGMDEIHAEEVVHVLFVPEVRGRIGDLGSVLVLTARDVPGSSGR